MYVIYIEMMFSDKNVAYRIYIIKTCVPEFRIMVFNI